MALVRHRRGPLGGPGLFDWGFPNPTWMQRFDDLFADGQGRRLLLVDEFEQDGKLVIRAELPGLDPEKDVEIGVADDQLTITAEHTEEEESADKRFHRKEIRYGSFSRSLPLPEGVKDSDIVASYKDGVLEVSVPLPPAPKTEATKIPVAHS